MKQAEASRATALEGRVALVTGGARGVGAAIVRALVTNGARVVVADNGASIDGRSSDPHVVTDFCHALGDAAIPFSEDIALPNAARLAVELALRHFDGLDVVVNNAAILRDDFIFEGDPVDYENVWRVNLFGAYEVLRAATPVLREYAETGRAGTPYRWGRVINVVSTAAIYGNYAQAAYASAKAGLIGLTRVVALDMARSGVTANAIAPFGASGPDYVGRFATFLATDAAQGITGQLFGVRGREVFLFSQPRPIAVATVDGESLDELEAIAARDFAARFTPLETDLEAFATEPETRGPEEGLTKRE